MAQQQNGAQGPEEPREFSDIREALAAVEKMRQHAFVLGETSLVPVPPLHRVAMVVVKLDPDGDDKVYAPGGGDPAPDAPAWSLSHASLMRLGSAAGIEWLDARVTERTPEYVTAQATGVRMLLDGTEDRSTDQYTYDLAARAEQARAKAEKWWNPKQPKGFKSAQEAGEAAAQRVLIEDRVHAMTKATSGAQSRVVEKLLRMKRGQLRLSELRQCPFVFLKLVPAIDYEGDPLARKMLLAKAVFGRSILFGASAAGFLGAGDEAPRALPPTTTGPAREDAPPPSEPARPAPAPGPTPKPEPREGALRDELRRPTQQAPGVQSQPTVESDPWDEPEKPAATWPTAAEFARLDFPAGQVDVLARALDAIGETARAQKVRAGQVEPEKFADWYGRCLGKLGGGR